MSDRIYSTVSFSDVDDEGYGVSTDLSFSARDKKDLLRLLRLSGIIDEIEGIEDIDEQAEYDYGKERTNRKGEKFPLNPYEYEASQEDERTVDPRFGDNPLKESREARRKRIMRGSNG